MEVVLIGVILVIAAVAVVVASRRKQGFSTEEEIAVGVAQFVLDRTGSLTRELSDAMIDPPAKIKSPAAMEEFAKEFPCEVLYLVTGAAMCALVSQRSDKTDQRCERMAALVEEAARKLKLSIGTKSVYGEGWKYFEALSDDGQPGFGCGELFSLRVTGTHDIRLYMRAGVAFMQTANGMTSALRKLILQP